MKKERVSMKIKLRKLFGDRCYWCGGVMHQPEYGKPDQFHADSETLEHHLEKTKGVHGLLFKRLAHSRCNV